MRRRLINKAITAILAAALMVTSVGGVTPGADIINDVVTATASAAVKKSGDFKYVKCKGGVEITKYTGKAKNLTIPAKIAGKKVVAIGSEAFEDNKKLRQVKLPDSIKLIYDYSFAGCEKLKKVTLPDEIEYMGEGAFKKTALKKIAIPKGIKYIDIYLFADCKKLKEVKLSDDVKIIDAEAFNGCEKLAKINLENIEEINSSAFKNNKSLTGKLSLKNVVEIESKAFYGCSGITGVEFSDSLQVLGRENYITNPFAFCTGIEAFEVDVNNANYTSVDGVIYNKTKNHVIAYPAKKAGNIDIPEGVTIIGEYAYAGAKINQVNMGKGIYEIKKQAFAGSDVTEVNMPLVYEYETANWAMDAFLNCKSLRKVVFPEGVRCSSDVAFVNCTALTEVVLPPRMTMLSEGMFVGCTSLETISLPDELKTIPIGCFYGCKSLKNVNLDKIEFIRSVSFYGCESLSGVLNLNVNEINNAAFGKCSGITEVNFNQEITNADYSVTESNETDKLFNFYHNKLDEIVYEDKDISEEYRYAGGNTIIVNPFAGCSNLTKINVLKGGEVKCVDGVLYTSDMKTLITYPAALTGKFNVPYGVEVINNCSFEGAAVSEVVCSNSVKWIREDAFYESNLKTVTLSKSVEGISDSLENCKKLEKINVHAGNATYESIDGMLCKNDEDGKNKVLLVYPAAKKGKTLKLAKNIRPDYHAFCNCKYLKKVYLNRLTDYGDDNCEESEIILFNNCKNIKLYLPKDFIPGDVDIELNHFIGKQYIYGFSGYCTGCKTYVKKGSKLAKKLDKKKVKYRSY